MSLDPAAGTPNMPSPSCPRCGGFRFSAETICRRCRLAAHDPVSVAATETAAAPKHEATVAPASRFDPQDQLAPPAVAAPPTWSPGQSSPWSYGDATGQPQAFAAFPAAPYGGAPYLGAGHSATRRRTRRGYWIAAAAIVVIGTSSLGYRFVSSHTRSRSAALPPGSGVSANVETMAPGGQGIVYNSVAGHFTARFLARPTERTQSLSGNGFSITEHAAADASTQTLVAGIDIIPSIPASEVDNFFRGVFDGITNGSPLTLDSETKTTFRGHPARQGQYHARNGFSLTVIGVQYGSQRAYLMAAPSGPTFTALEGSFVPLP